MPPVVRSVGYYVTFFIGVGLTSISTGLQFAGWEMGQYPTWLKIAIGAFPAWSAAFGLTAASHVPVREQVVLPSERYPDYLPDRVLAEAPIEELEDLDITGTGVLQPGYSGQQKIVEDDDTLPPGEIEPTK